MRTIALSEAEVHELRGAAWSIWQDDIGDEPTAAELGDHLRRTGAVLRLVAAAESGECEASEPILDGLAAYEVECAERAEKADMDGDRESWAASAVSVRDLLGRLREIATSDLRCQGCGALADALDTDGHCPGCEERSLLQDAHAAEVIKDLLLRLAQGAAERISIPDLLAMSAGAIVDAGDGRDRAKCRAFADQSAVWVRLRELADQRKAREVV